jgi:hypothetical protein
MKIIWNKWRLVPPLHAAVDKKFKGENSYLLPGRNFRFKITLAPTPRLRAAITIISLFLALGRATQSAIIILYSSPPAQRGKRSREGLFFLVHRGGLFLSAACMIF